jgi:hypothetical protein
MSATSRHLMRRMREGAWGLNRLGLIRKLLPADDPFKLLLLLSGFLLFRHRYQLV